MTETKKQKVRLIYKIGGFLAFLLLGYLGIRSYKLSVEKLKTNNCVNEIAELVGNIQEAYRNERSYDGLDYARAQSLKLIPKTMFRQGFREAVNGYMGGVDMFYSSLHEEGDNKAFEISFQGVSSMGCIALMRMQWDGGQNVSFIAVAGYPSPMPSGVLDQITADTPQDEIKDRRVFRSSAVRFASDLQIENACACEDETCSVVWKFF